MRPYVRNESGALVPDMAQKLFAMRDIMHPKTWRLCWSIPDSSAYVMAEGECSAVHHLTMRAAVSYGQRRYKETAKRAWWSN